MIRIFLDTNALISATFWEGNSYKILLQISKKKLLGFTSVEVLDEYRHVLKRDFEHTEQEADERVKKLLEVLAIVFPKETLSIISDDPSDNKILEGAAISHADFIISYDHHLLDLKKFRNITIIKPEELLKNL